MRGKEITKVFSIAFLFAVLVILASVVCFADTPPAYNDEVRIDVYVNGSKTSDVAYTIKGNIYLNLNTIRQYGDTTGISFDTSDNKAYFNSSEMDMFFGDAETTDFIKNNAGRVYLPIKYFKSAYHISLGSISQLCKIHYEFKNGAVYLYPYKDLARILVSTSGAAAVSMNGRSIGSNTSMPYGNKVTIISETASLYKVKDLEGREYYVSKADFEQHSGATVKRYVQNNRAKDTFSTKINLAWLMAGARTELAPEANEGLDVLSPVWMRLELNGGGTVRNNCEYGFVELCHSYGTKVWICVNNNFDTSGSSAYTSTVLKNTSLRNKAIAQYLLYACLYDADGINVDFEAMEKSVIKQYYTAFIQELARHCSKLGLTISVATPVANSYWRNYYDFAAMGSVVDYICPMAYEEHYSKAVGAGSTMSPPWYTSTTNDLINIVGPGKVLLGVPFFTQEWMFDGAGNITDVTAVTIKKSFTDIEASGTVPVWSEEEGQYIANYTNASGQAVKMWVEDPRSMGFKLNYVNQSGIAGTACWAYGQNTPEMLDVFAQVYKLGADPLSIPGKW